ncbi:MAG TPA: FMN-binding negative transcriptional regulator [Ramlibacter sp.]|nr:FMN-binding negative transcriptional regulator [Ramlibacter sp.]
MYTPKHFDEDRADVMRALIRAHPLATLVTLGAEGLDANHIPLQIVPGPGSHGSLVGHIARANPMLDSLDHGVDVLAVFHGPQAYISPSWYATKTETGKVVPTWNYAVVHVSGKLLVRDDPAWIRARIESLTQQMEEQFEHPWTVDDAPPDFIDRLLGAVVGIEIPITTLAGKWKVSQNQPAHNRHGVSAALDRLDSAGGAHMAQLVRERG